MTLSIFVLNIVISDLFLGFPSHLSNFLPHLDHFLLLFTELFLGPLKLFANIFVRSLGSSTSCKRMLFLN